MFVTEIVGVELPEEQDPADVEVVNVTVGVGQSTVLNVAAIQVPVEGLPLELAL